MTEKKPSDRYSPENLMRYHTALAVVDDLEKEGLISSADKRLLYTKLTEKYGYINGSIFAA